MTDDTPSIGRPLIELDMEKLEALMRLDPRREDAAKIMGCSVDTLERRIKEYASQTYLEFKNTHQADIRMSLSQLALKKALDGDNQMLNICLKHYCGWSEKPDVQVNVQNNIEQNVSVEKFDLDDRIKQLKGEE